MSVIVNLDIFYTGVILLTFILEPQTVLSLPELPQVNVGQPLSDKVVQTISRFNVKKEFCTVQLQRNLKVLLVLGVG